jgi:hypothetical protein
MSFHAFDILQPVWVKFIIGHLRVIPLGSYKFCENEYSEYLMLCKGISEILPYFIQFLCDWDKI